MKPTKRLTFSPGFSLRVAMFRSSKCHTQPNPFWLEDGVRGERLEGKLVFFGGKVWDIDIATGNFFVPFFGGRQNGRVFPPSFGPPRQLLLHNLRSVDHLLVLVDLEIWQRWTKRSSGFHDGWEVFSKHFFGVTKIIHPDLCEMKFLCDNWFQHNFLLNLAILLVTFLGWWKSDPLKGESWPPTKESKGHFESPGGKFLEHLFAHEHVYAYIYII